VTASGPVRTAGPGAIACAVRRTRPMLGAKPDPRRRIVVAVWLVALLGGCSNLDSPRVPPLEEAARSGSLERVTRLLQQGVDPNEDTEESSALAAASGRSNVEMVKVLLDHGARADWVSSAGWSLLEIDHDWDLDEQRQRDDIEIIGMLLEAGADPCQVSQFERSRGKRPSEIAAASGLALVAVALTEAEAGC